MAALEWKQEQRFSAKGGGGRFYTVGPIMGGPAGQGEKFGASVRFMDDNGEIRNEAVGNQLFDSADAAKKACEEIFAKVGR